MELFVYRRFDFNLIDALENEKIIFSSPNNFNDPFDSAIRYDVKYICDTLIQDDSFIHSGSTRFIYYST